MMVIKNKSKIWLLILLVGVGILEILIYINLRCLALAKEKVSNEAKRLTLLKTAQKIFPLNDGVFLELGRYWTSQAQLPSLSVEEKVNRMRQAAQYFVQAIKLNPGSYQAHFYLAQVGQFLRFWEKIPFDPIEELKKAAALTTFDEEAYFQVGRNLFALWRELSPPDREMTLKLLGRVISPATPERLTEILPLWEYNGAEKDIIEKLLPLNARMYRLLAEYLGRRGIKHELRLLKLAQAEKMEFDQARRLFFRGIEFIKIGQFKRGEQSFQEAQALLRKIKFYQNLSSEHLIDEKDYWEMTKELSRNLAFLKISKGEELTSVKGELERYLALEDDLDSLEKFIDLLRQRLKSQSFLKLGPENEFIIFYFETMVAYKKGAYRGVIDKIPNKISIIRENQTKFPEEVAELWRITAESYLKLDYLYDALTYFEKAREIKPEDLKILLGLRKAYERLNREDKWAEISSLIKKIIQIRSERFKPVLLSPQEPRVFNLLAAEPTINLKITFDFETSYRPLVAISLNSRVIKEVFLTTPEIEVASPAQVGENKLEITPLNIKIKCLALKIQI
ncbi:MAG: hypothetical protein J7L26_10895 [Candidatus Aminicenantes bacterium]|nr:hypothetical protein [Candidatus Aminicenantes bacterium]